MFFYTWHFPGLGRVWFLSLLSAFELPGAWEPRSWSSRETSYAQSWPEVRIWVSIRTIRLLALPNLALGPAPWAFLALG
jgi:hypothetical protein